MGPVVCQHFLLYLDGVKARDFVVRLRSDTPFLNFAKIHIPASKSPASCSLILETRT